MDVIAGANAQSYPVYYYSSAESVASGVTSEVYKTTRILLRRIEPTGMADFKMGSPGSESGRIVAREGQVNAVLTKSYYIGVYPVTQQQWLSVTGNNPSLFTHADYRNGRPVERVTYLQIRESAISNVVNAAYTWPGKGHAVASDSFMGKLRTKTDGVLEFDLPTEAQWEWACRAGTTGALNDGTVNVITEKDTSADPNLDTLGRYVANGGLLPKIDSTEIKESEATDEHGSAVVGSYLPNAWGLYDMHGNVWEWCLNWYSDAISDGTNPKGVGGGTERVVRGGSWASSTAGCRSAYRNKYVPQSQLRNLGFRVVANMVEPLE